MREDICLTVQLEGGPVVSLRLCGDLGSLQRGGQPAGTVRLHADEDGCELQVIKPGRTCATLQELIALEVELEGRGEVAHA